MLTVLEAKLNSIPGLEYTANDLPSTTEIPTTSAFNTTVNTASTSPNPVSNQVNNTVSQSASQPVPVASNAIDSNSTAMVVSTPVNTDPSKVKVSEHPDYSPFFKLLKVGVPIFVVQAKVTAAGLDPTLMETPDAFISI